MLGECRRMRRGLHGNAKYLDEWRRRTVSALRGINSWKKCQGRSYRGFGGFGRTPHGPEKVRKNRSFFFFERDRTRKRLCWKGRTDAANRKQVMQDEVWPGSNGTSPKRRRHQRKPAVGLRARRGVARCECQTPSYSVQRRASSSTAW